MKVKLCQVCSLRLDKREHNYLQPKYGPPRHTVCPPHDELIPLLPCGYCEEMPRLLHSMDRFFSPGDLVHYVECTHAIMGADVAFEAFRTLRYTSRNGAVYAWNLMYNARGNSRIAPRPPATAKRESTEREVAK